MNLASIKSSELGESDVLLASTSIAVVGPDRSRYQGLVDVCSRLGVKIRSEVRRYPVGKDAAALAEEDCDAIVIDLDSDPVAALDLVETLTTRNAAITSIIYSRRGDPDLLVNCMRAGARELLREPISESIFAEALLRAAARRPGTERRKRGGKVYVFCSAKGGAGTSTIATNFSIAVAQESKAPVALVDLNFELGDVSVLLNLSPRFSLLDAVQNPERLDWDFLSGLMVEHKTGVHVLAAPDRFDERSGAHRTEALEKIIELLQKQFTHVVIDAGRTGRLPAGMMNSADAIYLVSQVDVPSLRNSQRLASHLCDALGRRDHLHIVLNRYDPRKSPIPPAEIEKALAFPVAWRVPNDYAAVNNAANAGLAVTASSPVGKVLRQMAQAVAGPPPEAKPPKTRAWKLFGSNGR